MIQKFKVAHLVSCDTGGASKAAYRLHTAMKKNGIDSSFFACHPVNNWEGVEFLQTSPNAKVAPWRLLSRALKLMLTLTGCNRKEIDIQVVRHGYLAQLDAMNFDLVHFHWVDGSVASLSELAKFRTPIMWTLHDMRAFTGGYYYLGSKLDKWMGAGGQLPAHDMNHHIAVRFLLRYKRNLYRNKKVAVIAPSSWMETCVRESHVFQGKCIRRIPYEIAQNPWQIVSREDARSRLGIDDNSRVILFGADTLSYRRKGGDLLVEALKHIDESNRGKIDKIVVISFGAGEIAELTNKTFEYRSMGRISDEADLAGLYAAADVFVAPSREDNLPNVVLESLASGTPVIAFNIGGMPDMIEDGVNGRLVTPFSITDLSAAIIDVLNWSDRQEISIRCRVSVRDRFDSDLQCEQVSAFYKDFLRDSATNVG